MGRAEASLGCGFLDKILMDLFKVDVDMTEILPKDSDIFPDKDITKQLIRFFEN